MIAGCWDGQITTLLVGDSSSGAALRRVTSHGDGVSAVAMDPAGERIATGDSSGAVRVGWATGEEPHLLLGHSDLVLAVAFSPDGRWIASASGDEIFLWPMPGLSKPPLHSLPYDELIAKLGSLTNLRAVRDAASDTGWTIELGPFPGWRDVPTW
jgi:WD40 repeat protein